MRLSSLIFRYIPLYCFQCCSICSFLPSFLSALLVCLYGVPEGFCLCSPFSLKRLIIALLRWRALSICSSPLGEPAITSKASFVRLTVFRWVRRHGYSQWDTYIEQTEQLSITIIHAKPSEALKGPRLGFEPRQKAPQASRLPSYLTSATI